MFFNMRAGHAWSSGVCCGRCSMQSLAEPAASPSEHLLCASGKSTIRSDRGAGLSKSPGLHATQQSRQYTSSLAAAQAVTPAAPQTSAQSATQPTPKAPATRVVTPAAAATPPAAAPVAAASAPAAGAQTTVSAVTAAAAVVAPTVTVKVQQQVDPACGRLGASVVEDYSVMLACTNVGPNQNKFYRMQVLGAHAPHMMRVATLHACRRAHSERRDEQRISHVFDSMLQYPLADCQYSKGITTGYLMYPAFQSNGVTCLQQHDQA